MKFVLLGVFFLFLIGFFVLLWKASRNWRWYQILPVCVTMILAITILAPTAGVLKSRSKWHEVKEDYEVRVAKLKEEFKRLQYGDAQGNEGVISLQTKLTKLAIEAGRSWRGLQFRGGNSASFTLASDAVAAVPDVAAADAEGEEGAPPLAPRGLIPEGLVVYGFTEVLNPETQIAVPRLYLGEFVVTRSAPAEVVLQPTSELTPIQKQTIDARQATQWSIYELLPLDGHSPFIAEGSSPDDDNVLGRVDEDLVRSILGPQVPEETLKSYLEDGRRLTDSDPPLTRWLRVEFLKNHTIDVDSPDKRGALDGDFFDATGRAVDARLQHGENGSVQFKKGESLLMQEVPAKQLISDGVAKLLDRYYLRPLNDYRFILRHIRLRLAQLANQTQELEEQSVSLNDAISRSAGMLVSNLETNQKLEQDLEQFRKETAAIKDYTQALRENHLTMKKEMSRLHKQNIALEQRIRQLHQLVESQNSLTQAR